MSSQDEHPLSNRRIRGDVVAGVLLFAFGLVIIVESRKLVVGNVHTPGPGLFPLLLGCLVTVLSAILLIAYLIGRVEAREDRWEGLLWHKVIMATVALLAYSLTLEIIGFVLGTFLLLAVLLRLIERKAILFVFLVSSLVSLGTYTVFKFGLYIQLPRGVIPF